MKQIIIYCTRSKIGSTYVFSCCGWQLFTFCPTSAKYLSFVKDNFFPNCFHFMTWVSHCDIFWTICQPGFVCILEIHKIINTRQPHEFKRAMFRVLSGCRIYQYVYVYPNPTWQSRPPSIHQTTQQLLLRKTNKNHNGVQNNMLI